MSLQAHAATTSALPEALSPLRPELNKLAETWLDHGASEVAVLTLDGRVTIAGVPGLSAQQARQAPIPIPGESLRLEVAGVPAADRSRVFSDAELLGRLAVRERELRQMTLSLISANDHMIALHDLATTSVMTLDVQEIRALLADEALRLTAAAAVVITGSDHAPFAAGSFQTRTELLEVVRDHVPSDAQLLRCNSGVSGADVAVAPLGDAEAGVIAVAAHRGQSFDGHARDIIDAMALRVRAQTGLARMHQTAIAAQEQRHASETLARLRDTLPTHLPTAAGITTAAVVCEESRAQPGFAFGTRDRDGATFCIASVEGHDVGAGVRAIELAGVMTRETAAGAPVEPAQILERCAATRDPEPSHTALAIARWDQRRASVLLAGTEGFHVLLRRDGRVEELQSSEQALSPVRLEPGDGLMVTNQVPFTQENVQGRPLGSEAVIDAFASAGPHSAQQLAARMTALLDRHRGAHPRRPGTVMFVLVREPSS